MTTVVSWSSRAARIWLRLDLQSFGQARIDSVFSVDEHAASPQRRGKRQRIGNAHQREIFAQGMVLKLLRHVHAAQIGMPGKA